MVCLESRCIGLWRPLLPYPVRVIGSRGVPPAPVAVVVFESTTGPARDFVRVVATIVSEVTDLLSLDTLEILARVLIRGARRIRGTRVWTERRG